MYDKFLYYFGTCRSILHHIVLAGDELCFCDACQEAGT